MSESLVDCVQPLTGPEQKPGSQLSRPLSQVSTLPATNEHGTPMHVRVQGSSTVKDKVDSSEEVSCQICINAVVICTVHVTRTRFSKLYGEPCKAEKFLSDCACTLQGTISLTLLPHVHIPSCSILYDYMYLYHLNLLLTILYCSHPSSLHPEEVQSQELGGVSDLCHPPWSQPDNQSPSLKPCRGTLSVSLERQRESEGVICWRVRGLEVG